MEGELMSGETIGEVPEVPKRPRKTLIAILLIVIVGVAAVSVFAWWYTQKAPEEEEGPPTPSPEYNTYSKYGFSFEYPKGMSINEVGAAEHVATNTSGGIVGELIDDKQELVNIVWVRTVLEPPHVEIIIDAGFESMEAKGIDVEKGQLVTSTKSGHEMLYQYFTATSEGGTLYGIFGAWYCGTSERYYELILFYSEQDVLSKYQQYLDSFVCH